MSEYLQMRFIQGEETASLTESASSDEGDVLIKYKKPELKKLDKRRSYNPQSKFTSGLKGRASYSSVDSLRRSNIRRTGTGTSLDTSKIIEEAKDLSLHPESTFNSFITNDELKNEMNHDLFVKSPKPWEQIRDEDAN